MQSNTDVRPCLVSQDCLFMIEILTIMTSIVLFNQLVVARNAVGEP